MNLRILAVCLVWFLPCLSADTSATLAGRVSDPNGAMIPKAKIEVTNTDTSLKRSTESNAEGLYVLPNLPPGRYRVQVQAEGFETLVHDGVVLRVQDIVTQNYSMKIGSVATSVSVESGASMVQVESGAVGTVIDRRFVENMPLNGRSFQSLIFLTPGVVLTPATTQSQGQFSVNGQRSTTNYFTVDGVSANFSSTIGTGLTASQNGSLPAFTATGGTNGLVSVDALQEFRIQTSSYSAEYGRSPGAQIAIVTRSGTNQLHGTAFDYFRNDVLDANDWFANRNATRRAPLRQHDFGGVLGGPVVVPRYNGRDRTFFFLSYEGLRLRQPQTVETSLPSRDLRAKLVGDLRTFANAFPVPSSTDLGNGLAQFAASYSNPTTLNAGSIRLDQQLSKKNQFFFRYNESAQLLDTRSASALSSIITTDNRIRTSTLALTSILKPTLSNDFRANYSTNLFDGFGSVDNFEGAVPPPDSLLFPAFADRNSSQATVSILALPGGPTFSVGRVQKILQRQVNVIDTGAASLGKHLLKFGVDYRRTFPIYSPVAYSQLLSFNDQAALLAQRISNVSIGALSELRLLYVNMSFFFGDTWRASSRLSLTYGVRWEHNPPPTEASGRTPLGLANINDIAHSPVAPAGQPLYRNRYANFAPRLGVAYQIQRDPGREFVVRGGVGIFYDLGTSQAVGGFLNYPFQLRTSLSNQPYPLTLAQILPPVPVTMPPYPGSSGTYDPDANLPYTVQWNVALEKALGASQTVSLTYSAALGRRLVSRFTDAGFPASFRNPNFLTDNFVRNILSSDYHALEVQFRRRLARGLQALGSYVWSHAIDDASDDTSTTLRRGDADMDRRQAFKAAVSYDLPTVASRRALSTVLSHWALDGLISAVTGPPQGFTLATSLGPDGTPIYRTLDLVFGVPIYIDDPHSPGGRRINGAAFASAPSNQIGTLGRNALRGPPLNQTDLSLRREFVVKERLRLQARLDAFNLLNHPNFGLFNLGVSRTAANFGQASSMYGRGLASGAGGFSPLYQIGGPRTLQLSLKLVF